MSEYYGQAGGVVRNTDGTDFDLMSCRVLCAATSELSEAIIPKLQPFDEQQRDN